MAHHGPWHLDEGPFRLQQIRQVKERRDGTPMLRPQLRLFRCQGCTVKLFGLAGCRGTFKTSRFHLAYTLILLTFTISMCIYIYVTYIDAFYLSLSVWDPEIDSASSSLFCSLRRAARLVTDWRVLGWVAPSCASVPSNALRKNLSASMLRRTTLGKRPGAEHHPTLGDGYIYIYTYPYNYIFIYMIKKIVISNRDGWKWCKTNPENRTCTNLWIRVWVANPWWKHNAFHVLW